MTRFVHAATIAALAIAAAHAAAHAQTPRPPSPATQSATADPKSFVAQLGVAGLAEVHLGQLALKKGQSADVKTFGQMMIKEHTRTNAELTRIGAEMKLPVPTRLDARHEQIARTLTALAGAEFDAEYARVMVMSHEEVVSQLQAFQPGVAAPSEPATGSAARGSSVRKGSPASANAAQALAAWAAKTLPVIQQHLEHARKLQQQVAR